MKTQDIQSSMLVKHALFEFQMLSPYNEIFVRQHVLEAWYLKISGLISPLDCFTSLLTGLLAFTVDLLRP